VDGGRPKRKISSASGDGILLDFGVKNIADSFFDGSAKRPISALRCISKSLRRTAVRLAPRDLRAVTWRFFRNRLDFDFLLVHHFLVSR
jgi:hypothetical protein